MLGEILLVSKGVLAALACEPEWMVAVWRFKKIPWQRPRSKLEQVGIINGVCLVNTRQGPWSIRILRTTRARPSRVMISQLNTGVEWTNSLSSEGCFTTLVSVWTLCQQVRVETGTDFVRPTQFDAHTNARLILHGCCYT